MRKGKDEKEKGKEKGREIETERKDEKKKPGFAAKAVLAAGLMIAAATGCTERITNNYNCPDGEARDTIEDVQEDTGHETELPDVVDEPDSVADVIDEEVECIADLSPLTCDSSEPVAEGVISLDESLEVGGLSFELHATEEHLGVVSAIVAVVDECGELLKLDKISEGQTKTYNIEGASYHVTMNAVHMSEENPWADASVSITCEGDYCLVVGGIINQGEIMPFDELRLRLDDLDVTNPEEPSAVVSILDSADHVLMMLRIPKGEKEYFMGYRIDVNEIAPGYTFASKWANIDISKRCED